MLNGEKKMQWFCGERLLIIRIVMYTLVIVCRYFYLRDKYQTTRTYTRRRPTTSTSINSPSASSSSFYTLPRKDRHSPGVFHRREVKLFALSIYERRERKIMCTLSESSNERVEKESKEKTRTKREGVFLVDPWPEVTCKLKNYRRYLFAKNPVIL